MNGIKFLKLKKLNIFYPQESRKNSASNAFLLAARQSCKMVAHP
jgi:hypothetical protein